ncbi:MAG: redoxin domain-containing protein [Deltaproteobacteria bacterium]|nr:redoxin domain-containing protein [Deltaproteobacteria bacterium]
MKIPSIIAALILAGSTNLAFAQFGPKDSAPQSATEIERIKVGQAAPDFTLEDSDGKAIALSELRGKKSVILVFYRGYW